MELITILNKAESKKEIKRAFVEFIEENKIENISKVDIYDFISSLIYEIRNNDVSELEILESFIETYLINEFIGG